MPVEVNAAGEYTTELATTFADDPVLGIVENLGLSGGLTDALRIYVGILAAVILLIATNAAVIGLSRLTFSMGQHRQLPEILRAIHPRFKTPYIAIIVFSAVAIVVMAPGETAFLGTIYAFGATLSFTVAHISLIRLRKLRPLDTQADGHRRRADVALAGKRSHPRGRDSDPRRSRRPRHVRRVRRRDGPRSGRARHRWRLDDRRDAALRRVPALQAAAAHGDGEG